MSLIGDWHGVFRPELMSQFSPVLYKDVYSSLALKIS